MMCNCVSGHTQNCIDLLNAIFVGWGGGYNHGGIISVVNHLKSAKELGVFTLTVMIISFLVWTKGEIHNAQFGG